MVDIVGALISLFLTFHAERTSTRLYLLSLCGLYCCSALYHWLSKMFWAQKLDHSMIFVVIAMTGLPYWDNFFPAWFGFSGAFFVLILAGIGIATKQITLLPHGVSGAAFVGAASFITVDFITHYSAIGSPYAFLWLLGTSLYGLQLPIIGIGRQRLDVVPKRFGR